MRYLSVVILMILVKMSFSQDSLLLYSYKKPNKIVKIFTYEKIYLELNPDTTFAPGSTIRHNLTGKFINVVSKELILNVTYENINTEFMNGTETSLRNNYNVKDSSKDKFTEIRKIDISKINSISFSTKPNYRHKLIDIGGALVFVSGFTALLVAPLVSINYKNGDFNTHTYYSVLEGCAGGLAIGIPIMAFSQRGLKNYKIKHTVPDPCDNDYYYLINK